MAPRKNAPAELKTRRLAFRGVFEKRGKWIIESSPDVPNANSRERTLAEARRSLVECVEDLVEVEPELARKLRPARDSVLAEETLTLSLR